MFLSLSSMQHAFFLGMMWFCVCSWFSKPLGMESDLFAKATRPASVVIVGKAVHCTSQCGVQCCWSWSWSRVWCLRNFNSLVWRKGMNSLVVLISSSENTTLLMLKIISNSCLFTGMLKWTVASHWDLLGRRALGLSLGRGLAPVPKWRLEGILTFWSFSSVKTMMNLSHSSWQNISSFNIFHPVAITKQTVCNKHLCCPLHTDKTKF